MIRLQFYGTPWQRPRRCSSRMKMEVKIRLPQRWFDYEDAVDRQWFELQEHERWLQVLKALSKILQSANWSRDITWEIVEHALYLSHPRDIHHCHFAVSELIYWLHRDLPLKPSKKQHKIVARSQEQYQIVLLNRASPPKIIDADQVESFRPSIAQAFDLSLLKELKTPGDVQPIYLDKPKVERSREADYRSGLIPKQYEMDILEAKQVVEENESKIKWRQISHLIC